MWVRCWANVADERGGGGGRGNVEPTFGQLLRTHTIKYLFIISTCVYTYSIVHGV